MEKITEIYLKNSVNYNIILLRGNQKYKHGINYPVEYLMVLKFHEIMAQVFRLD